MKAFNLNLLLDKTEQPIELTQFIADESKIEIRKSTNSNEVKGLYNKDLDIIAVVYKKNFEKIIESPQNYVVRYYPETNMHFVGLKKELKTNKILF